MMNLWIMLMMMWEDKNDYVVYKNIPDNFTALIYSVLAERKGFWRQCHLFSSVSSQEIEVLGQFYRHKTEKIAGLAWVKFIPVHTWFPSV